MLLPLLPFSCSLQVDMLVGDIYGGRDYTGIGLSGAQPLPPRHLPAPACHLHLCLLFIEPLITSTSLPPLVHAANTIASSFGKVVNQEKASIPCICSAAACPFDSITSPAGRIWTGQLPVCRQDMLAEAAAVTCSACRSWSSTTPPTSRCLCAA